MTSGKAPRATSVPGIAPVAAFLLFWALLLWRFDVSAAIVALFVGGLLVGSATRHLVKPTGVPIRRFGVGLALALVLLTGVAVVLPAATSGALALAAAASGGLGGWVAVAAIRQHQAGDTSEKPGRYRARQRAAGLAMDASLLGLIVALFWFDLGMAVGLMASVVALVLLVARKRER